jgi:hypothetical protein
VGFGVGGFGFWPQPPIPNPQSPIPNPQSPIILFKLIKNIIYSQKIKNQLISIKIYIIYKNI